MINQPISRKELEEIERRIEFMKRDPDVPFPILLLRLVAHIRRLEVQLDTYDTLLRQDARALETTNQEDKVDD